MPATEHAMGGVPVNMRFATLLMARSKRTTVVVLPLCLLLVAALGWVDYVTGAEIAFAIFYMLPTALAAWYAGGLWGCAIALAGTAAWYGAERAWPEFYSSPIIPYWNAMMRLLMFLATAGMVAALRRAQQGLERKVEERTNGLVREISERQRVEEALLQSRDEIRSLSRRLAHAEEEERKSMARELHDQVGQRLSAIGIDLSYVEAALPPGAPPRVLERLKDAADQVVQTAGSIREITSELRPLVLDDYGLVSALEALAEQSSRRIGARVQVFGSKPESRPGSQVETALFRIAQEALANVAKHAHASEVIIELEAEADGLRMAIMDDGVGFDTSAVAMEGGPRRMGLLSMRERALAAGGTCHVVSRPGEGTQVIVRIGEVRP
jgi:signal transduction histidine kinase